MPRLLNVTWSSVLLGLILLGILFVLFMVISAACVKVHKRDFFTSTKKQSENHEKDSGDSAPLPSAPEHKGQASASSACIPNTRYITIGFFSDTHGSGCLRSPKWIARQFIENHCDIVLFGGDCVHSRTVHRSDLRMLTEVSALLKEKGIRLLSVYGNHDWELTAEDFARMGTEFLLDTWQEITTKDGKLAICGISDNQRGERPWGHIPDDFAAYDGLRLLLVHNPDFVYTLPDLSDDKTTRRPFDYMLSGHLHGGQVHLPGNLEFTFFREDRIAREEGILYGQFRFRGYDGFISKGAGNGFLPIRLMARPEIHILHFHL